jgi:1-phosphatidylinositol phosphodiesterase
VAASLNAIALMKRWISLLFCLALPLAAAPSPADWMSPLPDTTPISQISIPGTHDSGALLEPFGGTAKCQTLGISEQLEIGVRFLDVRCRHIGDRFQIHHGLVDQKTTFEQVLTAITTFLKTHPRETVIMSVQEEYKPEANTRSFEDTLLASMAPSAALWWRGNTLPPLQQARGKIVMLCRFKSKTPDLGIPAADWPGNRSFQKGLLAVQDHFEASDPDAKWKDITAQFDIARKNDPKRLSLNFTSATGQQWGLPNIPSMASPINTRLLEYLKKDPKQPLGVVITDFITPELAAAIYSHNP